MTTASSRTPAADAADATAPTADAPVSRRLASPARAALVGLVVVAAGFPFQASAFQLTLGNTFLLAVVGAVATQIIAGYAHLL